MPILPNNTLSSIVNLVNRADQDSVVKLPLSNAAFTLDSSGVAGFFGGESAVRAMSTVNIVPNRRWFGWYNSPGSYEVAKQYSKLANSHIFDALFPGDDSDPAKILMVDGRVGPEHTLLYLPSERAPEPIGHLGSLIARKVSKVPTRMDFPLRQKHTMDARVTLVKLNRGLSREVDKLDLSPSESNIFAIGTILISIGGCVACALVADWFCLASIALGIIANGVACSVIGSGQLYLKHNPPAQAFSPGDVVLRTDTDIIVLVGNEGSVSPFTRARFLLRFGETPESGREQVHSSHSTGATVVCRSCGMGGVHITTCPNCKDQHTIHITPAPNPRAATASRFSIPQGYRVDISVILLLSQFLAQLLLIPQGTLFGQIMFIGTLVPSWVYHSYLSSFSLDLQTDTLFRKLSIQEKDDIYRYQFNTWTEAVVFTCLAFREIHPDMSHPTTTEEMNPAHEGGEEGTVAAQRAGGDPKEDKVKDAMADEQKKHASEKAQAAQNEKRAFRRLLGALLPGKTDVWQAFKESLVRKLGATDDAEKQIELTGNEPFKFGWQDSLTLVLDASGKPSGTRPLKGKDKEQLDVYQKDAENALDAWRSVRTIASLFRNHE